MGRTVPLRIPPGAYRNGTEYQAKGRWRDVNLVRWRDGAMQPVGGWTAHTWLDAQALPSSGAPRGAISWTDNSGNNYLAWGQLGKAYVMEDDGTITDISPTLTSSGSYHSWAWDTFGEIPVACYVADGKLWEWDLNTASNLTQISGSPTSCTSLCVTDERFIFALGDGGDPRSIRWCDRDDRTTWTPASTNQAGGWDLDTEGEIRFAIQMRGEVLIVTSKDAWVATYVGYPDVYDFRRIGSCSAMSNLCGVRVDDRAFWLGERTVYMYSGGYVQTVPCDVSDFLFGDIVDDGVYSAARHGVYGWHHSEFNEVWWLYPTTSALDSYVAYNYVENHWSYGAQPFSTVVDRVPFDKPIGLRDLTASGAAIVNHNFIADPGYTLGSNWQITGGVLNQTSPTASSATFSVSAAVAGKDYLLVVVTQNRTAGTLTIVFGDSEATSANGTQSWVVAAATSPETLTFTSDGTWDGDVTSVLVYHPWIVDLESGYLHDASVQEYAKTGPLEIGDGERRVHVTRVIPDETSTGDLTLTFSHREYPSASETDESAVTAANPTDVRFSGRQFTMKVAPSSDADWRSGVHRVELAPGGRR